MDSSACCGQCLVHLSQDVWKLQNEMPLLGFKVYPKMSDIEETPEFTEGFQVGTGKLPNLDCSELS